MAKSLPGWLIACGLLVAAIALVSNPARTQELQGWIFRLTIPLDIWLVGWPVTYTIWPKRAPRTATGG